MHLRWVAVVALLAACRTAPPAQPVNVPEPDAGSTASGLDAASVVDATTVAEGSAVPDVSVASPKNDPRCPSGLLAAEGSKCSGEEGDCTYKEGMCGCNAPRICAGIAPKPPPGPQPGFWGCTPLNEKLVRLDGCPMVRNATGIPCKQPGRKCVYSSCAWERSYAVCSGGSWVYKSENIGQPPP